MPIFVLLSLLFHAGLFLFLMLTDKPTPPPKKDVVEVEYLPSEELTPAPEEVEQGVQKKKKEQEHDQIVEQKKQINDETPDDSKYLSAFNQVVEKQTRAEKIDKFNNTAKGGQPEEGVKDGEKKREMEKERSKPEKIVHRAPGELPTLKDLTPKFALTPGPQGPKMDEQGEASATDDHITNVQTGMQTMLSTREFVYYAYYNRIKEGLRQHWEPNVREKVKIIYRQGRTIASAKDRVTQVVVTLNPQGELVKVEVLTQSGVVDLDSAAVEAFRQAAPFPNPPKGMVEADGTIKIRWDFVLET
jgi:protein TonB